MLTIPRPSALHATPAADPSLLLGPAWECSEFIPRWHFSPKSTLFVNLIRTNGFKCSLHAYSSHIYVFSSGLFSQLQTCKANDLALRGWLMGQVQNPLSTLPPNPAQSIPKKAAPLSAFLRPRALRLSLTPLHRLSPTALAATSALTSASPSDPLGTGLSSPPPPLLALAGAPVAAA